MGRKRERRAVAAIAVSRRCQRGRAKLAYSAFNWCVPKIMTPVVFIHTNDKQMLAAKVSEYSLRSRSKFADRFEVRILRLETTPYLCHGRNGRRHLWANRVCIWRAADLQTFAPLRLMVPHQMNFEGRALVLDPDVFAVGDIYELISRDMHGKAIISRRRPDGRYTSSVMLLDCSRLTQWRWRETIDAIFALNMDLYHRLSLATEDPESVGSYEDEWNHFDTLNENTRLLHNTERSTQPWKTGLPIDFDLMLIGSYPYNPELGASPVRLLRQRLSWWFASARGKYQPHPHREQEEFFFAMLKEAMASGAISESFVAEEIRKKHIRSDTFELLGKISLRRR